VATVRVVAELREQALERDDFAVQVPDDVEVPRSSTFDKS
jgi:hypothetical protein